MIHFQIEKRTRKDIELKKQQLRQLVGDSYRYIETRYKPQCVSVELDKKVGINTTAGT